MNCWAECQTPLGSCSELAPLMPCRACPKTTLQGTCGRTPSMVVAQVLFSRHEQTTQDGTCSFAEKFETELFTHPSLVVQHLPAADWWVMTDLLSIHSTSTWEHALEGLTLHNSESDVSTGALCWHLHCSLYSLLLTCDVIYTHQKLVTDNIRSCSSRSHIKRKGITAGC